MVTPTFAAGLGVLVAAGLAANMPRTVLHFSSPVPGDQCTAGVCATEEPNTGTLASARPGVHISPTSPATSGSATTGQHQAGRRGGGPARPSGPGGQVTVTYQVTHAVAGRLHRRDQHHRDEFPAQQPGAWLSATPAPG